MCGIAGIAGCEERDSSRDLTSMRAMLGALRHRGPDQFGIFQGPQITLGSARLSIIDLDTGQQPIGNEDETLWIVFNGEIFNFVELRSEMECRGHHFRTNSDTEVILHLYEEYQEGCLQKLNGQFGLAIWDLRARRLFLARDRLGIRPLFYTKITRGLAFASEVKALLEVPGVAAEINRDVLNEVLEYWCPLPARSIFKGISEIPPGHYLIYEKGIPHLIRYWEISFPREAGSWRDVSAREVCEYKEEFRNLLADATRIRMRSDVPVGAYLSGGLDSSVVSRLAAGYSKAELTTFSIAFEDGAYDESEAQLRMARYLGCSHRVARASSADIARVFPSVVWHAETPLTRSAPGPMFLLSRLARDSGFKVVLTGEGADEFLAGYDIFKEAAVRRFWARQPASEKRPQLLRRLYRDIPALVDSRVPMLSAFFRTSLEETQSPYYSHLVRWRNNARLRRFIETDGAGSAPDLPGVPLDFMDWGPLQRAQYLESAIFLPQYLLSSQGDRMSMAHSVESRMPFLDYRVVEFCNHLPATLKLRVLLDKYLLRLVATELLPAEICQRAKRPYRAPISSCFLRRDAPEYVGEMLSPAQLRATGLFKPESVAHLTRKLASGAPPRETDDMAVALILSTQLIDYQFVSHFRHSPPVLQKEDIRLCVAKVVR